MKTNVMMKETNVKTMIKVIRAAVVMYTLFMCLFSAGGIFKSGNTSLSRTSDISSVYAGNNGTETSGVTELDSAKTRTNGLVVWFCHWIGGVVAVVAFIVFLFMAGTHQTEQRNTAAVVVIMGIAVYFAPSIVNYVLGKTVF